MAPGGKSTYLFLKPAVIDPFIHPQTIDMKLLHQITITALLAMVGPAASAIDVTVERLGPRVMQPQAITDAAGDVHLVWLRGDPKSCDVFYEKRPGGRTNGVGAMRVNSQPGSAIAIGTIRGANLALGRNGRVHVVWNGSSKAAPKPAVGEPLLYSRMNSRGDSFEPQRNLSGTTAHLDGGGSIAADGAGNVFAIWHASPGADTEGESNRRVFLARSKDDGATFATERPISPPNGACGCCGLRASTDPAGNVMVLYRSSPAVAQRDMTLLVSQDHGDSFKPVLSDAWPVGLCPMSSSAFAASANGTFAAWESKGQVFGSFAPTNSWAFNPATALAPLRGSKHPALAVNRRGEALVAWADGTGWQKGGSVSWRTVDAAGRAVGEATTVAGLPVWSYPVVFAKPDGGFVVAY